MNQTAAFERFAVKLSKSKTIEWNENGLGKCLLLLLFHFYAENLIDQLTDPTVIGKKFNSKLISHALKNAKRFYENVMCKWMRAMASKNASTTFLTTKQEFIHQNIIENHKLTFKCRKSCFDLYYDRLVVDAISGGCM